MRTAEMAPSKLHGHDPPSDFRQSSMRRLSSIASLHQLLPFSRRRSNNAPDNGTASCSSNVSLHSSTANNSETLTASSSQTFPDTVVDTPAPTPSQVSSLRRSGYFCLPDDPIGGMPRSRTFSNLPLPSRARKQPQITSSRAHSRHPSAVAPNSRLPTPPASKRRYISAVTGHGPPRGLETRNRLKRSDTEPLLSAKPDQEIQSRRSTAFKENFSLSPAKLLPEPDRWDEELFGSSLPSKCSSSYLHSIVANGPTGLPQHPSLSAAIPTAPPKAAGSSPYRNVPERTTTPGALGPQLAQRWSSQPVLSNVTNTRPTKHHEVKPTRLLSARQAPTPPPPRTLANRQAVETNRPKSMYDLTQLRQSPDLGTLFADTASSRQARLLHNLKPSQLQVSTAEPPAYWAGRLSALLDGYRNEELAANATALDVTRTRAETDRLNAPGTTTARIRRAFEHLYSLCVTEAARKSFVVFQMQYAALQNNPELSRPIKLDKPSPLAGGEGSRGGDPVGGTWSSNLPGMTASSTARKFSFMERLLGKNKRSSIA